MQKQYNDDYKPPTNEFAGTSWELVELEQDILRNRRLALGLTRQQVAEMAEVEIMDYVRLESGQLSIHCASFRLVISVCKALQLDPQRFIDCV